MKLYPNILRILLFSLLLAVASACSSPSNSSDANNKENSDTGTAKADNANSDELTILIPNYYNETEREQWQKVIDKFTELNEDIEVEIETGDVKVESGKLQTLLQSGTNVPDAVLMNAGPSRISVLSDGGLIQSLDEMYKENNWEEALRPFVYNLIKADTKFEVPHMVDAIAYFYHYDVFNDLGLEVPETHEEFIEILDEIKEKGDVGPIAVGARNGYAVGWLFGTMLEAQVGSAKMEDVLFGDGKWNDPEIVETANSLVEWIDEGYISEDSVTLEESDAKFSFLSGDVAMYAAGTYLITELSEEEMQDEVGFFMAPSNVDGEKSNPIGGIGQSWVLPTEAQNPNNAEKWLNFITSEEYAKVVYGFEDYNFILASSASENVEPSGEVLEEASLDIESDSGYNPSVFIGPQTGEVYYQNLQGLVGGLIEPKEAMDGIEDAAQVDKENGFEINIK